ncbi:MAG: ATP-binding protein [Spirochaetaceae bacterium]|jgi:hypothetical protein|nr:ATP-binding protein [Spirochaetaceae bacterium]
MILRKFAYTTSENFDDYWRLDPINLENINLFVAKNATGKTRTVNAMFSLSKLMIGKGRKVPARYMAEFVDESNICQYELIIEAEMVIAEKLTINGITRILRERMGKGEIYAEQLTKNISFQLPRNNLAILKRDILQHPYLEPFFEWANSVHYYAFGSSMNQEYGAKFDTPDSLIDGNSDNTVQVFVAGVLKFKGRFKKCILSSMKEIGYDLLGIDALKHTYARKTIGFEDYILQVVESDRNIPVIQIDMSRGMFRALSMIIHLTYHVLMKTSVTFIIDDIGEGLDFDRSSRLIKLLIETAEKNDNIQLIMSTNDRFVMNSVPLEYWQVIQRNGGECQVFNYHNSKEKFDEFEYTGLNNFDFLRTDFLNSKWEPV